MHLHGMYICKNQNTNIHINLKKLGSAKKILGFSLLHGPVRSSRKEMKKIQLRKKKKKKKSILEIKGKQAILYITYRYHNHYFLLLLEISLLKDILARQQ